MTFLVAVQFLTVLPLSKSKPTAADIGASQAYFPLVGLLLGLALAGVDAALGRLWPPALANALLLAFLVLATGALHFEGFLDTCDGLFGGHDRERRLEIMRDGRVGAYAVAGGATLVLVKWAALLALAEPARLPTLIIFPVLSRWAMALAIRAFPYAREQGLGAAFRAGATTRRTAIAAAIALAGAVVAAGWGGTVLFAVATGAAWLVGSFAVGRLDGLTGDVYGAICELAEVAMLLVATAASGSWFVGPVATVVPRT